MNPAAPRNPSVTRVLLIAAGALFLLNFYVFAANVGSTRSANVFTVLEVPASVPSCISAQIVDDVDITDLRDLRADLSKVRARLLLLRSEFGSVGPLPEAAVDEYARQESL